MRRKICTSIDRPRYADEENRTWMFYCPDLPVCHFKAACSLVMWSRISDLYLMSLYENKSPLVALLTESQREAWLRKTYPNAVLVMVVLYSLTE